VRRALLLLAALVAPVMAQAEPATLRAGEVLRGHFVQERFLAGFDRPVRSEGSFVLAPGHGLIWRGEKPFPVVTVITPAGMAQSMGGKETMRLAAAKMPFLARLHDVMTGAMAGDFHALDGEFSVSREGGRITLVPRRADMAQPVKAIVARLDRFVEEVDVQKPEGDRDHLVFSRQSVGTGPLSEDEAAAFAAVR
jgi:hypothetical protein